MINRRAVFDRHDPRYTGPVMDAPLSVGNGKFCFTADITGLQTFYDEYAAGEDAFPLCTMAEWGWHSCPPLPGDEAGVRLTPYDTYGRTVYYATDDTGQEERFKRIRQNAHKFHLGKIGFVLDGKCPALGDCTQISQRLSLSESVLSSEFVLKGETVKTETFVHPHEDTLYARVVSPLLKNGGLCVTVVFPYGSHKKTGADFSVPARHATRIAKTAEGARQNNNPLCETLTIERQLDDTLYRVTLAGKGFRPRLLEETHSLVLEASGEAMEFSLRFEPLRVPAFDTIGGTAVPLTKPADSHDAALAECKSFWEAYWNAGGIMDFSESSDSRAAELERRIVLSQYLIAIQSRGLLPPAETGHTCNSWYGKFHLEMHYWHHAHFALWGRTAELKRTLEYYKRILPLAREIAASQGYAGARWPKMCDPSGINTPSSIAVLLLWQQPHPIMLAELCHRAEPDENFLREYREVIVETAEFMKSFVRPGAGGYVVGPPYIPAQERHDPRIVLNAAYELEYFRWAFRKADEWLSRLGEKARYGEIARKLVSPALGDGVYLAHENCPETFTSLPFYTDHPSMLAMYGILDSEKIDPLRMAATLDKVLAVWDKKTFYGWDFPMMAMTACRLGRYSDAVDMLLMESPKNTFVRNGHNRMTGNDALPLYLPGNGGLLLAAAMMAAGYGNKQGSSFPAGFTVRTEGMYAYI